MGRKKNQEAAIELKSTDESVEATTTEATKRHRSPDMKTGLIQKLYTEAVVSKHLGRPTMDRDGLLARVQKEHDFSINPDSFAGKLSAIRTRIMERPLRISSTGRVIAKDAPKEEGERTMTQFDLLSQFVTRKGKPFPTDKAGIAYLPKLSGEREGKDVSADVNSGLESLEDLFADMEPKATEATTEATTEAK